MERYKRMVLLAICVFALFAGLAMLLRPVFAVSDVSSIEQFYERTRI